MLEQTGQPHHHQRIRLQAHSNNQEEIVEETLDLDEEDYDDDDYTPDSTPSSSSPPPPPPPLQATNTTTAATAASVQAQLQPVGSQVITQTTVRHKSDASRIGQHLAGGVQFSDQASSSHLNNQFILQTAPSHQADTVSVLGYNRMIEVPAQQQVSGHVQLQQIHALRMGIVDQHQQQQRQYPWATSVEQVAIQVQKTQPPMSHNERLKFSSSTPPSQESRSAHLHHRLSDASSLPQADCFKMRGGALSNSIRRRLPQHPTSKALQHQQQPQAGRQTTYQQQLEHSPLQSRQASVTGLEPPLRLGTSFDHSAAVVVCPRPVSPSPSSMFFTAKLASMTIGANGQLEQRTTLTQQQQEQVVLEHEQNEQHQHHQMMSHLFNENQQQQMQLINQVETNQIERYRRSAVADNSLAQQQQQQLHSPIPTNHRPSYSASPGSGLHSSVDKMLLMRDIQSVVVSDHHPLEKQPSSGGHRNRGSAVTVAAQATATVTVAQPTTTPTKSATAASPVIRSTIDEEYLSRPATAFRNQQSSDEQLMILLGPKQRSTTNELDDIELQQQQQHQEALLGREITGRETGTTLVNSSDVYNNARQIHNTQQHITGHRSSGDTSASGEHQVELMYELRRDSDTSGILLPLLPKAAPAISSGLPTQQGTTFAEAPNLQRASNFTNDHLYAQDHHYDEQQLQHYDRLG